MLYLFKFISMKKAPKIKRKGYYNGTNDDGIPTIDGNAGQKQGKGKQAVDMAGNALGAYGQAYQSQNNDGSIRSNALGAVGQMGPIGGVISGVAGIGDSIGKPIKERSERTDEKGNLVDKDAAQRNAVIGGIFSPSKALETRSQYQGGWTDITGEGYANYLENKAKAQYRQNQIAKAENIAKAAVDKREQGLSEGGKVVGKGGPKEDAINAEVKPGSFVVPAENADVAMKIREMVLGKNPKKANLNQKGGVPVKLSNGEVVLTKKEKEKLEEELGDTFLKSLAPNAEEGESHEEAEARKAEGGELSSDKAKTILKDGSIRGHELTPAQKRYFGWIAGGRKMDGGDVQDFANGGKVKPKSPFAKKAFIEDTQEYPTVPGTNPNNPNLNAVDVIDPQFAKYYKNPLNEEQSKQLSDSAQKIQPQTETHKDKTGFWDKILAARDSGVGQGLFNYGLAAYQISKGQEGLKNAGIRPTYTMDPAYTEALGLAKKQSQYGFSPEEKFALEQNNQNMLNDARQAARDFSGGNASNAFNMERAAINDAYMRNLQNTVAGQNLQREKQSYYNSLLGTKLDVNRQIFNDSMNAFMQKQGAAGNLLNTGFSNLIDANRFAQYMKMRQEENG